MDANIDRIKKKRGIIRTSTTKLFTKLESELSKQQINLESIEETLALLVEKEITLVSFDTELEDLIDVESLKEEIISRDEYKDKITIWKTRANRCLREQRGNIATNIVSSETNDSRCRIKLPKLSMKPFSGNLCDWPNFWAQFKSSIHDNTSLNNVDRFNYLRSVLSSKAETSILGLNLTSENYSKAIKILEDRYGRKELLIDSHMNKLLSLRPVKRSDDIFGLRQLYDFVEVQIRGLETVGIEPNSYGCLLFPILIRSLPNDMALDFNRQFTGDEEQKITNLLSFFKKEVETRERTLNLIMKDDADNYSNEIVDSRNFSQFKSEKYKSNEHFKNKGFGPASAAALNTVIDDDLCIFCEKVTDHKSNDCTALSVPDKKAILKRNGRCYLCFKKYHLIKLCRAKVECTVCHGRHNRALCQQVSESNSPEDTVVGSVVPANGKNEKCKQTVLLQTVRAVVRGPHAKSKVRILMDGGSQRTFVREDLSKYLKLPVVGEEELSLQTFGSKEAIKSKRRRVKVTLCNPENGNEVIIIEALESPEICSSLIEIPNEKLINNIKTLNVKLSDFDSVGNLSSKIEILIGSDYFWKVVTGKMKRVNESLMVMETKFGWSVQGSLRESLTTENKSPPVSVLNAFVCSEQNDDDLTSEHLKAFWELDSIGIINETTPRSISDDKAMKAFESTVTFKENQYEVCLPWKFADVNLPDNYENSKKRFNSLVRKFQKNSDLNTQCKSVAEDYLKLGIVEEVLGSEDNMQNCPVYNLKHQPVVRKDKETTQLRIVYDASSHIPGSQSLNDLLHPRPNLKVTCSPFLSAAVIETHLKKYANDFPETCSVLSSSMYVDDLLSGAPDVEEAYKLSWEAKKIMMDANMSLRKSNSEVIFDTTGFNTPFTVRAKTSFQNLWDRGVQLDDKLPDDLLLMWQLWCDELLVLSAFEIPRCYLQGNKTEGLQIHCSTDSSESTYEAVIHIRYNLQDDTTMVAFVSSESRIAPLKKSGIPRLELMGAQIVHHIKPVFEASKMKISLKFWTDSNITLCWIRSSPSKWKPVVGNRVGDIQSLSDPQTWRHCPGQENPADLLTRGQDATQLLENQTWWQGPRWLKADEACWPKQQPGVKSGNPKELKEEKRKRVDEEIFQASFSAVTEKIFDRKKFRTKPVDKDKPEPLTPEHLQTPPVKPISIKEGTVVQIHEDKVKKMMWKMGRVTEIHRGRDDKVRACTVRLPSGTLIRRPVQLLYPFELE